MKVVISYAMDGANVANIIASELEKSNNSLKMEHYPTPGSYGNVSFWNLIKNQILKADVILLVCTRDFIKNNTEEIKNLNKTSKYRFAWIIVDNGHLLTSKLPCDIELHLNNLHDDKDTDLLISKLNDYLKVVGIVVDKNKELKKKKAEKMSRMTSYMAAMIVAYSAIFISAFFVLEHGETFYYKNSAELVLISTAMLTLLGLMVGFMSFVSRQKRKLEQKEKSEFDKDLDASLSRDKYNNHLLDSYLSYLKEATEAAPNISNQLLDYLFATIRLKDDKQNKNETDTLISENSDFDFVDKEINYAIGNSDYIPLGHLKFNWKQMKGYYDISKKQATTSFGWAIAISLLGIIIITFAILSPLIPAFSKENSLLPIIGSVGGAFVELFAGTILLVYIKSLSQMNLYHKALSEYQRYLSCVNLVSKISVVEKQDSLYEEIIREEIKKTDFSDKEEMEKILETPRKIVKK